MVIRRDRLNSSPAEHQEYHADFSESAHLVRGGNPAQRMGADGNADNQVAEQRRQPQRTKHHHHQHGGGKQYEHGLQSIVHGRVKRGTSRILPFLQ